MMPIDKQIQALLKLATACQNNDFKILSDITPNDIKDFIDWRISILPQNFKFVTRHLKELYSFKDYLEAKADSKLYNESIQKLNHNLNLYGILEDSLKSFLVFKIVKNFECYDKNFISMFNNLPEVIRDELEEAGLKLAGDIFEQPA